MLNDAKQNHKESEHLVSQDANNISGQPQQLPPQPDAGASLINGLAEEAKVRTKLPNHTFELWSVALLKLWLRSQGLTLKKLDSLTVDELRTLVESAKDSLLQIKPGCESHCIAVTIKNMKRDSYRKLRGKASVQPLSEDHVFVSPELPLGATDDEASGNLAEDQFMTVSVEVILKWLLKRKMQRKSTKRWTPGAVRSCLQKLPNWCRALAVDHVRCNQVTPLKDLRAIARQFSQLVVKGSDGKGVEVLFHFAFGGLDVERTALRTGWSVVRVAQHVRASASIWQDLVCDIPQEDHHRILGLLLSRWLN